MPSPVPVAVCRRLQPFPTRYDADNDGVLSRRELHKALSGMLDRGEIDRLFDEADADGNGTLDFEEFAELMGSSGAFTGESGAELIRDQTTKGKRSYLTR